MNDKEALEKLELAIENCDGRKECVRLIHTATELIERKTLSIKSYATNQETNERNTSAEARH